MSKFAYTDYQSFEKFATTIGMEVIALRDPTYQDDLSPAEIGPDTAAQFPKSSDTTGSIEGDQRRWLKDHGNPDVQAEMQVQVKDARFSSAVVSPWLSPEMAFVYIDEFRRKNPPTPDFVPPPKNF